MVQYRTSAAVSVEVLGRRGQKLNEAGVLRSDQTVMVPVGTLVRDAGVS